MEHYPESWFEFERVTMAMTGSEFWPYSDGTGEVRCKLTIVDELGDITRTLSLPVMDYKNMAIPNPTARDVNDAKMRCLVKCIALFGLGLYIYAGEDIPKRTELRTTPEAKPAPKGDMMDKLFSGGPEVTMTTPDDGELWGDAEVPIGKWEGSQLKYLTAEQLEKLWEHRQRFGDYPDFMSALQEWRKG